MQVFRRTRRLFTMLFALAYGPLSLQAGDLNPPAGPVASTMKTLSEVEPRIAINPTNTPGDANSLFQITQPGSYYLTGNVQGVPGKHGIEIAASNVTLDLGGFALDGGAGSLSGIAVSVANQSYITVQNGSVSQWFGSGVDLVTSSPLYCTVRNVVSHDNAGRGIRVFNDGSVVECSANFNGQIGIDVFNGCTITGCQANNNNGSGIDTSSACVITGCIVDSNLAAGIHAFSNSVVRSCVAKGNGLAGAAGIDAGTGSLVEGCTCAVNSFDGITADGSCTVTGNACYNNGDDGIEVAANCLVTRNNCATNDPSGFGSGVYATGSGNRIEDNVLIGNNRGVLVDATDNFIVKNTARGNAGGNFSVAAGNELAPVITNPGSNGFATMTPWSNVAY